MDRNLDGLIPVSFKRKYVAVPGYIGRLEQKDVLVAKNGTIMCSNASVPWMKYVQEAVNGYAELAQARSENISPSDKVLMSFVIPGLPIKITDGRTITKDENGMYMISAGKDYKLRIREVLRNRQAMVGNTRGLPLDMPLHIKCTFYLKNKQSVASLPDLLAATVDLLRRTGIIKGINSDVVCRTDGSEIRYAMDDPRTVVVIRKMREGYSDGR